MSRRVALLLGANGALGREIAKAYAARNWSVLGFDTAPTAADPKSIQSYHTLLPTSTAEEMQSLLRATAKELGSPSAVINAAGGWTGGDVKDVELSQKTYQMLHQSLFSSLAATHIAATVGEQNVLTVIAGAAAALQPTPGMLAYGVAKAAVHHLVKSVAADPSTMPSGSCTVAVLPVTLDTPGNREAMPTADFSAWTPPSFLAENIVDWSDKVEGRPANGSLLVARTKAGQTTLTAE